jgi:hypothetical protein
MPTVEVDGLRQFDQSDIIILSLQIPIRVLCVKGSRVHDSLPFINRSYVMSSEENVYRLRSICREIFQRTITMLLNLASLNLY